ncbi:MAG: preprotein translocase subunit SecG [Arenimonas sp.]|uniref:preprotein translocase subunit SecG n=1 Tax=Arenimonas sp. TaxID=1872635 RepID=UPI0025C04F02|nr:preprotein translocase subunit SecG [Arenimonas sp.]MBW8369259.1 preprotein translocase subunit SecG [Arenimonas sp.]
MLLTIISVIYVLVAISMIVLILMQRGSGAAAGSGFGGGASATVFGARGSANFLSTATKWLAVVFFAMSLGMAWNATRSTTSLAPVEDIGAMSEVPTAAVADPAPAANGDVPVIPAAPVPAAGGTGEVPAAPVESTEAEPVAPAPAQGDEKGSQEG